MAYDKVIDSAKLDTALLETANAIREKTGGTEPIAFDRDTGFKSAVESIETGGGGSYEQGYADGYEAGNCIDPNWKNFGYFCYARPELAKKLKYNDTANATTLQSTFAGYDGSLNGGKVDIVIPSLNTKKVATVNGMCNWGYQIVEIGEMDFSNVTNTTSAYNACSQLLRISFVKETIKVSISFSNSPKLDDASIQSIIDGLADLTGGTMQTLDFHSDIVAKLTDEQILQVTNKNWSVT